MHDHQSSEWHHALPRVALAMNHQVYCATSTLPCEVIFGQKPLCQDSSVMKETGNATTDYIEDEAIDITIPSDPLDAFVHIGKFMHVYTFDCNPEINTLDQSSTAVSILDTRFHQPQLQP
jgi:hypothetical protein